jgi:hypothetical protein
VIVPVYVAALKEAVMHHAHSKEKDGHRKAH